MKSTKIKHSIFLALAALIWGTAFVAQSVGGDACGPYTFNCIRSFLGGFVLIPVIVILNKMGLSKETHGNKKTLIIGGTLCGVCLCLGSNIQQLGFYFGNIPEKEMWSQYLDWRCPYTCRTLFIML